MKQLIDTYLNIMAETKSEGTVKGHRSTLYTFSEFVDVEEPIEVLVKDVVNFRNKMFEQKTVGTVNTMMKRVKKFFDWCVQEQLIDISPAKEVKLLTESESLPKWLDEKQEDLLVRTMKKKYLGANAKKPSHRELAIVLLMLKAGLRVSEVCNLKRSELQIIGKKGKALIRGKAQQQRTVPLIEDVVEVLNKYIEEHEFKGEYLFDSQKNERLSERTIQKMLKQLEGTSSKNAVLDELHPHILRHTFAHNLAKAGMALESIARVLGHMKRNGEPNLQMTIRYTKANEQEIGEDMERILSLR